MTGMGEQGEVPGAGSTEGWQGGRSWAGSWQMGLFLGKFPMLGGSHRPCPCVTFAVALLSRHSPGLSPLSWWQVPGRRQGRCQGCRGLGPVVSALMGTPKPPTLTQCQGTISWADLGPSFGDTAHSFTWIKPQSQGAPRQASLIWRGPHLPTWP